MHFKISFFFSIILFCQTISSSTPALDLSLNYIGGLGRRSDSAGDVDPTDLSTAIKTFTAIGDSYAAGIGAGSRVDYSCSRYDHSYPALVASDERLQNATSQFLACSGATSVDILQNQVPKIKGSVDAITLSAGGNDVGLSLILNTCIFGFVPISPPFLCDAAIAYAQYQIKNSLPSKLDDLYAATKSKLTLASGRLYVTGYAQFFDSRDSQCDFVQFKYWHLDNNRYSLTQSPRTQLNNLVNQTNDAIRQAVGRAGNAVVFVDYDSYFGLRNGRYCEPGVAEPAPDRDELLFFETYTEDRQLGWKKVKRDVVNETIDPQDTFPNSTFEGQIAFMLHQTLSQHPEWTSNYSNGTALQMLSVDKPPSDGKPPKILSASAGNETANSTGPGRQLLGIGDLAWFLPVSIARVFHPQPLAHSVIASLVLYHMEAENAKLENSSQAVADQWSVEQISFDTCARQAPAISANNNTSPSPTPSGPHTTSTSPSSSPSPSPSPSPSCSTFNGDATISAKGLNSSIISYCSGSSSASFPIVIISNNYQILYKFQAAANAPSPCGQLLTSQSSASDRQQYCVNPLTAIAASCSKGGGSINNICGTWKVCVAGNTC